MRVDSFLHNYQTNVKNRFPKENEHYLDIKHDFWHVLVNLWITVTIKTMFQSRRNKVTGPGAPAETRVVSRISCGLQADHIARDCGYAAGQDSGYPHSPTYWQGCLWLVGRPIWFLHMAFDDHGVVVLRTTVLTKEYSQWRTNRGAEGADRPGPPVLGGPPNASTFPWSSYKQDFKNVLGTFITSSRSKHWWLYRLDFLRGPNIFLTLLKYAGGMPVIVAGTSTGIPEWMKCK